MRSAILQYTFDPLIKNGIQMQVEILTKEDLKQFKA